MATMTSSKRGTLIVVVGPTGSGKSALAVELAKHFSAPIISTDSRQVYRGMAIGTAQPTAQEQAAAQHYFIADSMNDEYYDKFFDTYVTDERVYKCKKEYLEK